MILRKASHIKEDDVIRLRHSRYSQTEYTVLKKEHAASLRSVQLKLQAKDIEFGPTENFHPDDLLEIIL